MRNTMKMSSLKYSQIGLVFFFKLISVLSAIENRQATARATAKPPQYSPSIL